MVPPELFLVAAALVFFVPFLPPLWLFLVLVVEAALVFSVAVGCVFGALSLSPPVFCATAKPAPRTNDNTSVAIFFIRFSILIGLNALCLITRNAGQSCTFTAALVCWDGGLR